MPPGDKSKRAYGSGSISERNDVFYARVRIDGQQVQRRLGPRRSRRHPDGLTRQEAEHRMRELTANMLAEHARRQREAAQLPHQYTVAELGKRYVEHGRQHRGLKASTLTDIEGIVRVHLAPFFGPLPIQRIDPTTVESLAAHLRNKKGAGRRGGKPLKSKTIENVLGTLAAMLNFAARKKWIALSPMSAADLPRPSADAPLDELAFLEPEEVKRLVESALPGQYRQLDRSLYALAAFTGLRQGELRGLRWEHVDLDHSLVHVFENVTRGRRSSPKGKRHRRVPLAATAAKELLALREISNSAAPRDPVFACPSTGNPMARTPLMTRYRKALVAASLDPAFSFHDLRHTFGTTMARAGVPVGTIQAWMGHADLSTTQIYMHYAPAHQDAARIDAAFGSNSA